MAQESSRNRCHMAARDASHKISIKWALSAKRFVVPSLQYMCERVQKLKTKYAFWVKTKNCYLSWLIPCDYGFSWLYKALRKRRYFMGSKTTVHFYSFCVRRNAIDGQSSLRKFCGPTILNYYLISLKNLFAFRYKLSASKKVFIVRNLLICLDRILCAFFNRVNHFFKVKNLKYSWPTSLWAFSAYFLVSLSWTINRPSIAASKISEVKSQILAIFLYKYHLYLLYEPSVAVVCQIVIFWIYVSQFQYSNCFTAPSVIWFIW